MANPQAEVKLGPQGRIVIPAGIRAALGVRPGDTLIVRVVDGQLRAEKREAIAARLRERFRVIPPDVDLAGELIAERREQARKESTP